MGPAIRRWEARAGEIVARVAKGVHEITDDDFERSMGHGVGTEVVVQPWEMFVGCTEEWLELDDSQVRIRVGKCSIGRADQGTPLWRTG